MGQAAVRKQDKHKRDFRKISPVFNVLFNLMFILASLAAILPVILVIMISLTDEMTILKNGYSFFPEKFSLAAYEFIFRRGAMIMRAYGITLITTFSGTIATTAVIALYAYPLSRSNFKYKGFFSGFVFFTMIFSGGMVPWVMVYTQMLKINNTLLVLVVPYLLSAWYVMIMRTFYKSSIPEELLESARIDGAGEFRTFLTIVLPLSTAGLATVALFSMLTYWNDWYLPLMFITKSELYNIQYLMNAMMANVQFLANASQSGVSGAAEAMRDLPTETVRMAIAVIAIGPIVFAYPFFQRYFIKGLTIGAVKG